MTGDALFGRKAEEGRIERFLRGGRSGALLLEGPGGIGKTSLWQFGLARARERGMRVLAARSSEEERHLSYSGLADLLSELEIGSIDAIPGPQLAALESALLIRPGDTGVNPQAVAAGLLSVLRTLALTENVLVAVDDLPWLDEPTAVALAFAARRLDSVRFLFAARSDGGGPVARALERSELEHLPVGPLGLADLRQLLHTRLGLSLSRQTLQQIFTTCDGNPLYALELGKAFATAAPSQPGTGLPLSHSLEEELSGRVSQLDPSVRTLLLAVALGPGIAASAMPAIDALPAAIEAGVVIVEGDRIRPSHPLLGTAAAAYASPAERRDMHQRLASVVADRDQELRAHHLALANDLPDLSVAATVAAGAARAMHRGAAATAAQLGQHAVRLTPMSASERIDRQLTAAEYLNAAGELEQGQKMIPPEIDSLLDTRQRVRAYQLAADLGLASPPLPPDLSHRAWTDRALAESRFDPDLYASVVARCVGARAVSEIRQLDVLEAWLITAEPAAARLDRRSQLLFMSSLAWLRCLRGASLDDLAARASGFGTDTLVLPVHQSVDRLVALQRMWRGETTAPRAALRELLQMADERGEAESYLALRLHLCELELRAGNFATVAALLDEWAQETTDGPVNAPAAFARCHALLAAYRGREQDVEIWLEEFSAGGAAGEIADRWQWLEAQRARGIALLFAGSPAAAVACLQSVWDYTQREGVADPGIFPVAGDLVEALLGSRARSQARVVTGVLSDAAAVFDHPWASAVAKRCSGLLQLGTPDATRALIDAADDFEALGLGFERARTLLALGASYRGQRQKHRSAQALEQAAQAFEELGSDGWAARARSELSRSAGPSSDQTGPLTSTEEKIALLVASGRRNREVAAELFISEKTVEAHLSHIYAKLEIRSRTELAARFHST